MKWGQIPLGQVITLQRGYDLPEQARREGIVPVVTSSGITGCHEEAAENGPGVITGRYGTIGEVHFVECDYWPHNTTLFVKDFKGNDPSFVRYLLTSLNLALQVSSGAVPGVNRNVLHAMNVPNVPKRQQIPIASTLRAYDDLIENNRRRMALLEESARHLYQEWFVRLRFPGHEHTRITDGVPEGWERVTVAELVERGEIELQTGPFGTQLKSSDYTEDGAPVINVRNIGFGDVRPEKLQGELHHQPRPSAVHEAAARTVSL
jgi:type I restriction enzyme S subunit